MNDNRGMTYGEKAVGLTFNPSGDATVLRLKQLFAEAIDILQPITGADGEKGILAIEAVRQAQTAQMWAVKAVTFRD